MKIAPPSADLLIELAIGAGLVLAAVWAARAAMATVSSVGEGISDAAGKVWDTATDVAWSIAPTNHENVIYQTVNTAGGAVVNDPTGPGMNADGSWSLGGWLYDVTHPEIAAAVRNTGGATGGW